MLDCFGHYRNNLNIWQHFIHIQFLKIKKPSTLIFKINQNDDDIIYQKLETTFCKWGDPVSLAGHWWIIVWNGRSSCYCHKGSPKSKRDGYLLNPSKWNSGIGQDTKLVLKMKKRFQPQVNAIQVIMHCSRAPG